MLTTTPRERLTQAAATLFYQQGVRRTTLAEIAQTASVPLGNVYYHFRTKDALVEAVTDRYAADLRAAFQQHEAAHPDDARAALLAFLKSIRANSATLVRYGCPYGTLCQELEKVESPLIARARSLIVLHLDWLAQQLRRLGKHATALALAEDLLIRIQGAYVVAGSMQSPAFLERQLDRLGEWVAQLA